MDIYRQENIDSVLRLIDDVAVVKQAMANNYLVQLGDSAIATLLVVMLLKQELSDIRHELDLLNNKEEYESQK